MEFLLERLKNDMAKIQFTIKKEGENLVQKIQELDLSRNFQEKKKQLEKLALSNFKKIEPLCQKITTDFANKVKKAAIDLNELESKLRNATDNARVSLQSPSQVKKTIRNNIKRTEKNLKRAVNQTEKNVKRAVSQTQKNVKKAVKKKVKTTSTQIKSTVKKIKKKAEKEIASKKKTVKKKLVKKVFKKKASPKKKVAKKTTTKKAISKKISKKKAHKKKSR